MTGLLQDRIFSLIVMASDTKKTFLNNLAAKGGALTKLPVSQSLFELGKGEVLVYVRYSKLHSREQSFYGLRKTDLQLLSGRRAIIAFLWEGQPEPLLVPYSEFEEVFHSIKPADDGQYKAQVFVQDEGIELYLPRAGRFNVERFMGWAALESFISTVGLDKAPKLNHNQVQTLLGAIGVVKGYDVWVPVIDRARLDWKIASRFSCRETLPTGYESVESVLQEVDVLWIGRGSSELRALFEVEHSTPIYSGLLRFNDIHLTLPDPSRRFSIVSNNIRRALFGRQLNRPTFKASGLVELCTFLEYFDVYEWHKRMKTSGGRIQ
jgi:hypothetical protein